MKPRVYIVNAFCHQGKGGNGAGVVLAAGGIDRKQKLHIAQRVGLSETVFVSDSPLADFRLEYFTPVDEVDLCGHATIATFVLLHQQGLQAGCYTIDTRSGRLQVSVSADGKVWMQQCCPVFHEFYCFEDFRDCFPDLQPHPVLPIQAVSTGLKDIMFPVGSVDELDALKPNFDAMTQLNHRQGVVGIHAFALTGGDTPVAVCRNFAPRYGIPEESATGTSNCALAGYLFKHFSQSTHYSFLQGLTMDIPSAIEVRMQVEDSSIIQIEVGGVGQVMQVDDLLNYSGI